jgi:hypothetical protein
MKKLVLALSLLVSTCATSEGVGFGSGEDDYKQSPCACVEIPQKFKRYWHG